MHSYIKVFFEKLFWFCFVVSIIVTAEVMPYLDHKYKRETQLSEQIVLFHRFHGLHDITPETRVI